MIVTPREFGSDTLPSERVQFVPPAGQTTWAPVGEWDDAVWAQWLQEHQRQFNSGWTDPAIWQYLKRDRYTYGFGLRPNGERAGAKDADDPDVTWLYLPTPKGVTLHKNQTPNLLWGGSAGGSKSWSALWEAISSCWDTTRDDYRVIIVRRELEQLRRTHLDKIQTIAARIGHVLHDMTAIKVTTHPAVAVFKHTGAKIIFAHCQNPGDEEKYLSEDYDLAEMDEATRLLSKQIVGVAGRVRNDTKINRVGRMVLTTNPGGPSAPWCAKHFITKSVKPSENERYDPDDYTFIAARLYDNPYYMDADGSYQTYEKRLYAYDLDRRRQLLDGDWSAIVGQFFKTLSEDTHVRAKEMPDGCVIERWIAWGSSEARPGVCHWVAVLPDGHLHVFAEYVFHDLIAADAATQIKHITDAEVMPSTHGGVLRKSVGDPMMFAEDDVRGETHAMTFRRNGIYVIQGDANRIFGWERLRHWYGDAPDGEPWLTYSPDCTYAVKTIPALVRDETNPEDLDKIGDEQAANADRFGVMARPTPRKPKRTVITSLPGTFSEILAEYRGHQWRPGMVA